MSVKITELPILDSLADNDIVAGVDVSGNVTSKIEMSTLKNYIDTNTQYTAGTNIDITNNVISAPDVPTKEEFDSLSTIFNAFPTESDEDESMTLDGTAEVKFKKFDLKGNTSQTTYSGKNLLINIRDEGYTVTSNGITFKVNADKSITVSGTATSVASMALNTGVPVTLSAGTYTLSKKETTDVQVAIWYDSASVWTAVRGDTNTIQKTISENTTFNNWRTLIVVYQGVTVNTTVYPMLEKSSTETSYEPFVGGTASPTPSSPIPVNVVSGDNEIEVCGKNKLSPTLNDINETISGVKREGTNGTYTLSGTATAGGGGNVQYVLTNTYTIQNGDYLHLCNSTTNTNSTIMIFNENNTQINNWAFNSINRVINISSYAGQKIKSIGFYNNSSFSGSLTTSPMIINSNTVTTFEPYIGNTYNIDLPVENLFDKDTSIVNGSFINGNGGISSDSSLSYQNEFIEVEQNTDYIISSNEATIYRIAKYDSSKNFISRPYNENPSRSYTINTGNAKYIKMAGTLTTVLNSLQIEKGSKANSYTPYGTTPIELCKIGNYQDYIYKDSDKWYLHKEIGKVVFTGGDDETWNIDNAVQRAVYTGISTLIKSPTNNDTQLSAFTNLLQTKSFNEVYSSKLQGISCSTGGNLSLHINRVTDTGSLTLESWKNWLSSNNIILYYILLTPTTTEITYTPLIEQLNAIKLATSKQGQTNISQVNNDKPFIIDAEAIKDLSSVLDRIELLES